MKKIFDRLIKRKQKKIVSQEELIEFVQDKQNIEKAAEGSMQKRNDLIDRVGVHERAVHGHVA